MSVASSLGCVDQTAACLRSVSIDTLLAAQGSAEFSGNVDGKVLTQPIGTALMSGQFNHVPVMEGSNHDEWRFHGRVGIRVADGDRDRPHKLPGSCQRVVSQLFVDYLFALPPFPPGTSVLDYVVSLYPLPSPPTSPGPSIVLGAVGTDGIFVCNSQKSIQLMAGFVPVFAYEFNDPNPPPILPTPVSGMPYGAYHASEVLYIFNMPQPRRSTRTRNSCRVTWSAIGGSSRAPAIPTRPVRRSGRNTIRQMISSSHSFCRSQRPNRHLLLITSARSGSEASSFH